MTILVKTFSSSLQSAQTRPLVVGLVVDFVFVLISFYISKLIY